MTLIHIGGSGSRCFQILTSRVGSGPEVYYILRVASTPVRMFSGHHGSGHSRVGSGRVGSVRVGSP